MSDPETQIKNTEVNDDLNDDNKSLASTNSSENANGRLKIDLQDDEDTEPKEKLSPKVEQLIKIKTQPTTPTKEKEQPKEEKVREKIELKRELEELNATNFGGSQNSNDSMEQRKRGRKDRGLDGGYWSRMSLDAADTSRNKRRRTTTEFLNLSNLSAHNLNDSYHTDDSKSIANDNDDSQTESVLSKSSKRFSLFKSKSFLAVRADQNSFFLCQACHTIYEDSKKCKIQWLEEADKSKKPIRYKFGYVDWLDPSTIISKVHVNRVGDSQYMTLDDNDLKKVNGLLEKAVKEGGITVDFEEEKDSSPDIEDGRINQEVYDKEVSSSESDVIKKPKKKKVEEDSDFRPAESDIEDIPKPKKIEETKPKKVEKELPKEKPKVEKPPEKTHVPNSKSTIQIKKIDKNQPVSSKKQETSIVKKSPVILNGKKKIKGSDTDEVESDKETKSKESPTAKKRKLAKIISNRSLQENTKVSVLSTNPFFDEPTELPFISPLVQSKLAFRYVNLGDSKSLRNLIADTERVVSVHILKSIFKKWTPAQVALSLENKTLLEILIDDFLSPKPNRIKASENLFQTFSNGIYNQKSLGISNIRKLTESRGVREGNQAFNKDQDAVRQIDKNKFFDDLFQVAFETGCSIDMFKFLHTKWRSVSETSDSDFISYNSRFIYENIYKAVLFGHRKLAAHLIENSPAGHGFNSVHIEVLKAENNSDLKCQLRSNQCTKKPFSNDFITPIHCACINPDVKYLKILISITQNYDIPDKKNRRPVHYAAVCEGMAPLEYLITRVSPYEPDSDGNTPLHYACLADRSVNCDILLNFALKKQENDSVQTTDVVIDNKFGLGGINRPNRRGLLPLHLAIQRGNFECVKVLVNYNANLEYSLPNSMDKITPLMYAVQLGNFKIVKFLIEKNAKIEALDRLKRNALTHAAMSGSTEIMSYLLRLGSNPNFQDSSGNTPLHYAAAYGWFFSVKTLIEAGANYNTNNDWKLSPFGAAFLKGHVGVCDYLLGLYPGKIDVNFRTEDGESLVMLTVSSAINENTVKQLDYVVNKLNANVKSRDPKGNNAFHYLAANSVENEMYRVKLSDILHKAGCNPNLNNNDLVTPFYTSLNYLNFKFARHLIKNLNIKIDSKSKVLSLMADKCVEMDCCHVIFGPEYNDQDLFAKFKLQFEDMAKLKDENGHTPFQSACLKLKQFLKSEPEKDLPLNLSKFLIFLYKNCKSDPNDLIYEKVESLESEEIEATKTKYHPVLFNFISEKCLSLFLELTRINQECINFSLCDSDGFNLIQKSISLKKTKFTIQLLELPKLYNTSESLRNLILNKNESILQLCIKSGEFKVFEYILDLMLKLKNSDSDLENFSRLLKHEDKESRNLMHYFSDLSNNLNGSFLQNFRLKIEKIFGDCSILRDLCQKKDKFKRQPIQLSLLNGLDLDLQFFLSEFSQFDSLDSQNRLALHYLFLSPVNEFSEPKLADGLSQIDPVECLSVLLEKTPKDLIDSPDVYGCTPLHYAAIRGATISCSILISNDSSILTENNLKNTPLSSAIYFKRESTVLQLLRSHTNGPKSLNGFYYLPKEETKSDPEMSCHLLKQPENEFKNTSLHLYELILSYKWDGINWLVLTGLNEYKMTKFDSIESAVLAGEPSLALRLIEKMERELKKDELESILLLKSNNYYSRTLLMTIASVDWSSLKDHETMFRLLNKILKSDKISSYLLQKDDFDSTAVHYACFMLNYTLLDYLFGFLAADPSLPQAHFLLADVTDLKSQSAYSLFFWHIGRLKYTDQDFNKIKEYTMKYVFKAREQLACAFYPLGKTLSFKPEDFVIDKKVLDYPLTSLNGDKISALLYAINRQDFKMSKFLLKDLQFDCNTVDSDLVPAIVYAIKVNNVNICNLLLNYDFEVVKAEINFNKNHQMSKTVARTQLLLNTLKVDEAEEEGSEFDEETSEDKHEEKPLDDSIIEYNLHTEVKKDKITVKTNIILDSKDSKSKTLFHHLAEPLAYGSFVNKKMATLLFAAYKSNDKYQNIQDFLKRVDSNVKTAVDYAIRNGNWDLYDEFKKILGPRVNEFRHKNFEVEDKYYDQIQKRPDYKTDSEKFLKNASVSQSLKQKDDYFKVDPLSNMNKICSLVWDEKTRVPYDVILTKTDVTYGQFGMHNFYKMQLFTKSIGDKFDENQSCILFTRWGRVGDVGMYQRTPFSNFKEAKEEFLKIFRQKTGNDFLETVLEKKKPFESKTRKYNLVKLESRQRPKLTDIKFDLFDFKQQNKDVLFEKCVFKDDVNFKHFWEDLLNVGYLKSRIHLIPNLSTDYLPLTQLSDENLHKAYSLLDKIRALIEKRMELEKLSKKDHIIEYINLMDQITILSNDYYELIPQMNFNYEKLKPVSNEEDIEYQTSILNQLTQAQVSCRILMGAKYAMTNPDLNTQNPFDYVYKSINCKLEILKECDMETQYILRYANSTKLENCKIRRVFKLKRLDEQNMLDKIPSRYLLWHGTSAENMISILSRGLVKSPSDSKCNGNRYGKGIYFSDSFQFSSRYSNGVRVNKNGVSYVRNYILLCEVGLGKVKELRTSYEMLDKLPEGFDSVKVLGRMEPDPNNQVVMPSGCVMPLGDMVQAEYKSGEYIYSRSSNESQYVIYNEKQCSVRYIIQFDFIN